MYVLPYTILSIGVIHSVIRMYSNCRDTRRIRVNSAVKPVVALLYHQLYHLYLCRLYWQSHQHSRPLHIRYPENYTWVHLTFIRTLYQVLETITVLETVGW